MENPSTLLRRAMLRRQGKMVQSAPAAPVQAPAMEPRHTSSHSSYTALMRSHDRVSTRHIAPRNGA